MHPRQFFSLALKAAALLLIGFALDDITLLPLRGMGEPVIELSTGLPLDWLVMVLVQDPVLQIVLSLLLIRYASPIAERFYKDRGLCPFCGYELQGMDNAESCTECMSPTRSVGQTLPEPQLRRCETRGFGRDALRLAFCASGVLAACWLLPALGGFAIGLASAVYSMPWQLTKACVLALFVFTPVAALVAYCFCGAPHVVDWLLPKKPQLPAVEEQR